MHLTEVPKRFQDLASTGPPGQALTRAIGELRGELVATAEQALPADKARSEQTDRQF